MLLFVVNIETDPFIWWVALFLSGLQTTSGVEYICLDQGSVIKELSELCFLSTNARGPLRSLIIEFTKLHAKYLDEVALSVTDPFHANFPTNALHWSLILEGFMHRTLDDHWYWTNHGILSVCWSALIDIIESIYFLALKLKQE